MWRVVISLSVFLDCLFAGNCADGRPGTTIVFLNGILGEEAKAGDSLGRLADKVISRIAGTPKDQGCLSFRVAFNPSEGFWGDLTEAIVQRLGAEDGSTLAVSLLSGSPVPPWILSLLTSYTPDSLRQRAIPDSARPVVDAHVRMFEAELAQGNALVIVAHSQGNFFANEEYEKLANRGTLVSSRFKILAVATPDRQVAGGGPYTTLCSDFIWRLPGALPYNVNNNIALCSSALPTLLVWQHLFDTHYLTFDASRNQIIEQIVDAIQVRPAGTGTVKSSASLDGVEWSSHVANEIQYRITCGSATISPGVVPLTLTGMPGGSCTMMYLGGGPSSSRLVGISPCSAQSATCTSTLGPDQTLTFSFTFASNPAPTAAFALSANGITAANGQVLNLLVPAPNAMVSFDASPSQGLAGASIVSWSWTSNGSIISSAQKFQGSFPVGSYTISLIVTDSAGSRSPAASATLNVAQASYTVTELGSLGAQTFAFGLNNVGQVVGQAYTGQYGGGGAVCGAGSCPLAYACIWTSGVPTNLGNFGGLISRGHGINDAGMVVGAYGYPGYYGAGFSWQNGTSTILTAPAFGGSNGTAVNNAGQIVGSFPPGDGSFRAYRITSGARLELGTLGGSHSQATAINSSGQVVGWSEVMLGDPQQHAFYFDGLSMKDLGTLGGTNSQGLGVNDLGQTVGFSQTLSDGTSRAFLHNKSTGVMTDLGTLGGANSQANGINNDGIIVGWAENASGEKRAFVRRGGVMRDLNSIVVLPPGIVLYEATAINSRGQITVNSTSARAYLLTPTSP